MKKLMMRRLSPFWGVLTLAMVQNLYLITSVKAQTLNAAVCVTEAYRSLNSSQAVDVCKNATPFTAKCVTEAYRSLNRSQTVEICKNATADTGKCVTEAYRSLNRSQTVEFCRPLPHKNIKSLEINLCSQIQNVRQLAQQESLDTNSLNALASKYCNNTNRNVSETSSQGLKICNQTNVSVSTAIGYSENNRWYARGWYRLASGTCSIVYSGSLKNRYYFVYAHSSGTSENLVWAGNTRFCISKQAFRLSYSDTCDTRSEGFIKIDVGSRKEFTYNLTR